MAIRAVRLTAALLMLLSVQVAAAAPRRLPAGAAAQARGILGYEVQMDKDVTVVSLLGRGDARLGRVEVSWAEVSGLTMTLLQPSHPALSVVWDARAHKLSLVADGSAVVAELTYDHKSRSWRGTAESQRIVREQAAAMELIANAVAESGLPAAHGYPLQIRRSGGSALANPKARQAGACRLQTGADAAGVAAVSCSGRWLRSGDQVAVNASSCCMAAQADVNLQCWNSYCTGCCAFQPCDKLCVLGDFYCTCEMQGQYCTQQDQSSGGPGGGSGGGPGGGGGPGDGGGICDDGSFVSPDVCSICGGTVVGSSCEIGLED